MADLKRKRDIINAIKAHTRGVAKHRDALRKIKSDLDAICESTEDGVRELENAIDELSKHL